MLTFHLTPASIGYLTQLILAVVIVGFFVVRALVQRGTQRPTHATLLTAFLGTVVVFVLLLFLESASLPEQRLRVVYLENTVVGLLLLLLIQFAYHFPELTRRRSREARVVLGLSGLYTLYEAGFVAYRFLELGRGQVHFRPPWPDYVLIASFVWVPIVFVRQAVESSVRAGGPPGWASLWRPQGQPARAARAFSLVYLLPVLMSTSNLLRSYRLVSAEIYHLCLSVGLLFTLFLFAVVYVNSWPETTSFMVKLVGVTLATLLAVLGSVGWVSTPAYVDSYQAAALQGQTLRFVPNRAGGYDVQGVPYHFDLDLGAELEMHTGEQYTELAAIDRDMTFFGQSYSQIYVMEDGAVGLGRPVDVFSIQDGYGPVPAIFALYVELLSPDSTSRITAKPEADRLTITWFRLPAMRNPQARHTFQLVLYDDGVFEITYADLPALAFQADANPEDNVWLIGAVPGRPAQAGTPAGHRQVPQTVEQINLPGLPVKGGPAGMVHDYYNAFRESLDRLFKPLANLIVVSSVAILLGFPLLFYVSLVRPLNALLAGVRRVDAGNLEVNMPIQFQDEIGFLTRAFNGMVAALRGSIAGLEAQVKQRTQQLEWQNTELAQAKALAEERSQAAEAANRAKSVFLANMSHELRTPLNAVLGFAELMAQDLTLTAEQCRNVERIGRSGQHLLEIINDVLHLSRIEAGRVEIRPENVDLHLLLLGLEEMFRLRAEKKGLSFGFEVDTTIPRLIWADGGKLRQVLTNLLGNAVKFTPVGSVTLRVRCHQSSPQGQPMLLFDVQDTGIGIAPDEIEAIFDPFVQTASGQQTGEGTGLGLSISRQFVRLMGGELIAHSAGVPGQGSRFALHLPLRQVEVPAAEPPTKATSPGTKKQWAMALEPGQPGYRILIADDSEASRELLIELLRPLGLELREARDGQETITAWQEWRPHLIFMDWRMPVLDGGEAARQIKAAPGGRETVIVAVTASVFEENRSAVLADGFDDLLHKPVRLDNIVATLASHLGLRFVYREERPPAAPAEASIDLGGRTHAWLAAVRQAALEADRERLAALAGEIRDRQPTAAAGMDEANARFDYAAILDAVERATSFAQPRSENGRT